VVALEAEKVLRRVEEGEDNADKLQEHEGEAQVAPDSDNESVENEEESDVERGMCLDAETSKKKEAELKFCMDIDWTVISM
jgi:hypothetical protein